MPSIQFFYDGVDFRLKDVRAIKSWIKSTIEEEGKSLVDISVVFCTDPILLQINKEYLNHSTLTDIITFDYSENVNSLEGEIYISLDRVKENAMKFNTSLDHELQRVIIHGILHLLGYSDKKSNDKRIMRKKENHYLSLRFP
jgi:rRNA maturation RNase YbeY